MTNSKIISILTSIENWMCVYRNQNVTHLVKIRITAETCLIFISFVYFYLNRFNGFVKSEMDNITYAFVFSYMISLCINGIMTIVLSHRNSDHFEDFVFNIDAVHKLYENDASYQSTVKCQNKRFQIDLLLLVTVIASMIVIYVLETLDIKNNSYANAIINSAIELSLIFRYFGEIFVYYEFVQVIIVPLRFVECSMSEYIRRFEEGYDDGLRGVRGELERWGEASRLLVAASERLSNCFNLQITLFLLLTTVNYISLLYQAVIYTIDEALLPSDDIVSVSSTIAAFIVLIMLTVSAGQGAHNQAEKLDRSLSCLVSHLVASSEAGACAYSARALARRLRAAPLRVRLLGARAVRAALLTEMLAIIANYTVVLLQFNHVV